MEPETPSAAATEQQHDNGDAAGAAQPPVAVDPVIDADAVVEQPQAAVQQQLQQPQDLQPHWTQLCSSLAELDSTSDLLVQLLQAREQQKQADEVCQQAASLQQQQPDTSSVEQQQGAGLSSPGGASNSSEAVSEMQQQLSALLAEKQRIEADRQDMALQQGKYKGTIAQVGEGTNCQTNANPASALCWPNTHSIMYADRHDLRFVCAVKTCAAGGCPGLQ
jgi:hypothetical protein